MVWALKPGLLGVRSVSALPCLLGLSEIQLSLKETLEPASPGWRTSRKVQSVPAMCLARSRCSFHSDNLILMKTPRGALYSLRNSSLEAAEHHQACENEHWGRRSLPGSMLGPTVLRPAGFSLPSPSHTPLLSCAPPCRTKYLNPGKIIFVTLKNKETNKLSWSACCLGR